MSNLLLDDKQKTKRHLKIFVSILGVAVICLLCGMFARPYTDAHDNTAILQQLHTQFESNFTDYQVEQNNVTIHQANALADLCRDIALATTLCTYNDASGCELQHESILEQQKLFPADDCAAKTASGSSPLR